MLAAWITTVGIALTIWGAFLVFNYGIPRVDRQATGKEINARDSEGKAECRAALRKRYDGYATWGMVLVVFGSLLQGIGSWMPVWATMLREFCTR